MRRTRPGPVRRGGPHALLDAVEQLQGALLPASALETLVLPSRVVGYSPAMLDELTAAGEIIWAGAGAVGGARPGGDGWVTLAPAETAPLLLPEPAEITMTPVHEAVLAALDGGGALFFRMLADRVARILASACRGSARQRCSVPRSRGPLPAARPQPPASPAQPLAPQRNRRRRSPAQPNPGADGSPTKRLLLLSGTSCGRAGSAMTRSLRCVPCSAQAGRRTGRVRRPRPQVHARTAAAGGPARRGTARPHLRQATGSWPARHALARRAADGQWALVPAARA